ncbi:MAG: hypothetical protein WBL67_12475 [Nitrososphaeraceae archaeon]
METKKAELQKPVLAECQSGLQESDTDNNILNLEVKEEEVILSNNE